MLPISKMVRFFETVDEEWTSPVADTIAKCWDGHTGLVRCIRASANYVFHVQGEETSAILRFNHTDERKLKFIEAEIDVLRCLLDRGYPVNQPIPSRANRWVETVETELGSFHAVMFTKLPGDHIELGEMTEAQLLRWGKALGELHCAAQGCPLDGRPSLIECLSGVRSNLGDTTPQLLGRLDKLLRQMETLPPAEGTCGLIHYDFELDNLCWCGGRPAALDFDDCCTGKFVADIAYALRDLSDDRLGTPQPDDPRFDSFMKGYRTARSLPDSELELLPFFSRIHHMLSYVRLTTSLDGAPPDGEPEWASSLRRRLAAKRDELYTLLST